MSQHSSVVVLICTVVVAAMAPSPMVAALEPHLNPTGAMINRFEIELQALTKLLIYFY